MFVWRAQDDKLVLEPGFHRRSIMCRFKAQQMRHQESAESGGEIGISIELVRRNIGYIGLEPFQDIVHRGIHLLLKGAIAERRPSNLASPLPFPPLIKIAPVLVEFRIGHLFILPIPFRNGNSCEDKFLVESDSSSLKVGELGCFCRTSRF